MLTTHHKILPRILLQVGYVQGMGFIVAMLLLHMPEEMAFWTFVAIMKPDPDQQQGPGASGEVITRTAVRRENISPLRSMFQVVE